MRFQSWMTKWSPKHGRVSDDETPTQAAKTSASSTIRSEDEASQTPTVVVRRNGNLKQQFVFESSADARKERATRASLLRRLANRVFMSTLCQDTGSSYSEKDGFVLDPRNDWSFAITNSDQMNRSNSSSQWGQRVASSPYNWPHETSPYGGLDPRTTALVIVDMQKDFLEPSGYLAQQGADITQARTIIPQIQSLLTLFRHLEFPIYHTREGHRRGLSTLSSQQLYRSRLANSRSLGLGDTGPLGRLLVRGEDGHEIIDELRPSTGDEDGIGEEPIIDKPARSAFGYTDFQLLLDVKGVKNLIFVGVTTDQCVLSSMRDANDKGYDCLLVSDACWATPATHEATIEMIKAEGGILGSVSTTDEVIKAIYRGMSTPLPIPLKSAHRSMSRVIRRIDRTEEEVEEDDITHADFF